MREVCGPVVRAALERAEPGAFEQAVADAETFFGQELPAVQQWTFGPAEASRITRPVMAVLGEKSRPTFRERQEPLLAWLPHVEPFVPPKATHLLHVEKPRGMAEGQAALLNTQFLRYASLFRKVDFLQGDDTECSNVREHGASHGENNTFAAGRRTIFRPGLHGRGMRRLH